MAAPVDVIMSIKPRYVQAILEGRKHYEFRKSIFKRSPINHVYIYSSSPVQRIVGRFEIAEILEGSPSEVWEKIVKENAGIDAPGFFYYFRGRPTAYAIGIRNLHEFDQPIDPRIAIPGFAPPQSFCYLKAPLPLG